VWKYGRRVVKEQDVDNAGMIGDVEGNMADAVGQPSLATSRRRV
jgi:hypothetical protein